MLRLKSIRRSWLASTFFVVAVGLPGGVILAPGASAAPHSFHVATYSDQPVVETGQTFRAADVYVNRTGDNIVLSGSQDGAAPFYVDDLLVATVTRPDGSIARTRYDDSNGCTSTSVLTTPAQNISSLLQYGVNKVHLEFRDACGGDYGSSDIWISGTANFPAPKPTLPVMDGGTLIHVNHLKPGEGAEECTAAYSFRAGADLYMTTAKHCLAGDHPPNDDNSYIAQAMPVTITTAESPTSSKFSFAQELSCVQGVPACLIPIPNTQPSADMIAFKPDQAVPSGMVQTKDGLQPVLGKTSLDLLPPSATICHYGLGSSNKTGSAEQCGNALGIYPPGTVVDGLAVGGLGHFAAYGHGGDSGGPAYYKSPDGRGVYAVGLVVIAKGDCKKLKGCSGETIFTPIQAVESGLAARIVTATSVTAT